MKKIDRLIISAFVGPFILTFLVVVFILLTVQMMNYVDQIFGKNLSWSTLGQLVFHFSVFQTPVAFPLSVMLASLMTFGNLGEHFELTAIKSAGISLIRALMPIFIFVIFVTALAFASNNYLVPHSALKAYSLLYDIRQKKPALDIKEGFFYSEIENYKIKVDKKYPDGKTLGGLTIYNHAGSSGNNDVILADSGLMYTILNNQYLKFELFNGNHYLEDQKKKTKTSGLNSYKGIKPLTRTEFQRSEIVFDLSSFGFDRTDEDLFASNRIMRNFNQLNKDIDSLQEQRHMVFGDILTITQSYFTYSMIKEGVKVPDFIKQIRIRQDSVRKVKLMLENMKEDSLARVLEKHIAAREKKKDTLLVAKKTKKTPIVKQRIKNIKRQKVVEEKKPEGKTVPDKFIPKPVKPVVKLSPEEEMALLEKIDVWYKSESLRSRYYKTAMTTVRQVKSKLTTQNNRGDRLINSHIEFRVQWHKMISTAVACISMFLIGAPLGAIIKRGGIGFPVLVSIIFFIIYYVLSMSFQKSAETQTIPVLIGSWMPNIVLFPVGLFFLRQAKNDARLFEADFYKVLLSKINSWISRGKDKAIDS